MAELVFEGMEELQRQFKAMEYAVQQKVLTAAVKAAGEPIRERAAQLAPRGETEALAENEIISVPASQASPDEASVNIGPSQQVFYGVFQEFGTAFQSAQPFLQPAFDEMEETAIDIAAEYLAAAIEEALG